MVRRRFVGVVVVLTLFTVVLAGCGKDSATPSKAADPGPNVEQKAIDKKAKAKAD
jgi:hypothetical protein